VIVKPRLYIPIALHRIQPLIWLYSPARCGRRVSVIASDPTQTEVGESGARRVSVIDLNVIFVVLLQLLDVLGCPVDTGLFELRC
jgi:hypothetical protein